MFGHSTYLVFELCWALPVLALQIALGLPELWASRKRWLLAALLPTLYLSLADRFALANGIWTIHADRTTGILIAGLPLEEAVFFAITNLMVVQALILFQSATALFRLGRHVDRALHTARLAVPPSQPPLAGGRSQSSPRSPFQPGGRQRAYFPLPQRGKVREGAVPTDIRSLLLAGHRSAGGSSGATLPPTGIRSLLLAGYRAGTFGAVAGALLSIVAAAIATTDSVLEPLAQAVMQWTPVSVANVLLERLGPSARPLALLGALALLMAIAGVLSALLTVAGQRISGRRLARLSLAIVLPCAGLITLAASLAWQSSFIGGVAYVAGQLLPFAWRAVLLQRSAPNGAPAISRTDTLLAVPGLGTPNAAGTTRRHVPTASRLIAPSSAGTTRRHVLAETTSVIGGAGLIAAVSVGDAARRDQLTGLAGHPIFPYTPPAGRDGAFPVPGQSPEVTPVPQFYVVSKNAQDPLVDPRFWRLRVGGLAQRPFSLTFEEVRALPRVDQYVTFQCVSNPVGGSLMSNALWSGISLAALLERAGPLPQAGRVVFRAPDGHEESVPLDLALRPENLVAYAMNGELLTRLHGHPARTLLSGLYGFKQVKWLTTIELVAETYRGYWEQRGWDDRGTIRTTARVDLARKEGPDVRVAGMALAGRRSISRVQVRLLQPGHSPTPDEGWTDAELHLPPLSPRTWVQWRALLPVPATVGPSSTSATSPFGIGKGTSTATRTAPVTEPMAEARAVDGEGTPQEVTPAGPFPSGSAGYHRLAVKL